MTMLDLDSSDLSDAIFDLVYEARYSDLSNADEAADKIIALLKQRAQDEAK